MKTTNKPLIIERTYITRFGTYKPLRVGAGFMEYGIVPQVARQVKALKAVAK